MSHQFVENVKKQNEDHQQKMMLSISELEQSIRTSKENHLTRFLDLTAKLRTTLEGNLSLMFNSQIIKYSRMDIDTKERVFENDQCY